MKQITGIQRYKLPVIKQVKSWRRIFSIGYTINNNVKPLYGNRWLLDLSRSFHNLNVESLCFTPESNIILHAKLLQKNL